MSFFKNIFHSALVASEDAESPDKNDRHKWKASCRQKGTHGDMKASTSAGVAGATQVWGHGVGEVR
jgi:hypothetical protein